MISCDINLSPKRFYLVFVGLLFNLQLFAQQIDSSAIVRDSSIAISDTTAQQQIPKIPEIDSLHQIDSLPVHDIITSKKNQSGYRIAGVVIDKNTGEGVPFASIYIKGSKIGNAADLNGNFSLNFSSFQKDSLVIQAVGYKKENRVLSKNKNDYNFYIELSREEQGLMEVVIHAGEDPAILLLKQIIKHKPENNPDRTHNYKYEVYNKLEVDLERLSKAQFEKLPIPYMKKFSFIYKNLDTATEKTPFLPFYFTETISNYYFQRTPKKEREFIKASQVKGIKNESITKFMGSMYQNINSYDNFIPVFDKEFVSPISNQGLFYYKYKIIDTQSAYRHNIILVQFSPKRDGENCFYGDFWVVDTVFALQRISMDIPKDANINWVNRVSVYQEFAPVSDSFWFCIKDKFIADFTAPYGAKLPGFIGRKTTYYNDIVINDTSVTSVLDNPKYKEDVIVANNARNKDNNYWTNNRPDSLSKNEKAIYHMIDTLESMPLFTRYKNLIKFVASGVKEIGPIELGPYWNVYSSNPVEGQRFRFSMGTTPKLFKDLYLNGYVAYGTLDQRYKYNMNALWLLNRHPRMYLYASYKHDVDLTTSYYDQTSGDNIFSRLFRKSGIPWKLAFVNDAHVEFYKEYFSGFSHQLSIIHRDYTPYGPLPSTAIFQNDDGSPSSHVVSTEVSLRFRFAYKEKFLEGNYYRVSLGSKYPIVELRYGLGLKNVLESNYDYNKVTLSISDDVKIAPLGSLYYNVFAGKYFGTLPYPLLEIHPGNEFLYYNKFAFNMMDRYEFISDRYAGLNIEHNIGGGVFNYIPILKKAKLRQFWTAKVLYGGLSDANKELNLNKGFPFRTLSSDPYVELGTGISNILQIFRIDFVWRVSPSLLPGESQSKYFGIFGSVRFNF